MPRGFVPSGLTASFEGERVFKWGNRHCGEDKSRADSSFTPSQSAIVEPFLVGESERILLVGRQSWHFRYRSSDWRKNVGATIEVLPIPNAELVAHARGIAEGLGLRIAGIDFLVTESETVLLEVNA